MHQNTRLKRLLSLITALMLAISLLALLPEGVIKAAAADTEYGLWIAGTQVTSANQNDILGDGHVRFDSSANTLTITGTEKDSYKIKDGSCGLENTGVKNLRVIVKGHVCFGAYWSTAIKSTQNLTFENGSDKASDLDIFREDSTLVPVEKRPTIDMGANTTLTFKNLTVNINSDTPYDACIAGGSGSKLAFEKSEVDCLMCRHYSYPSSGGVTAIYGFTGGITFDKYCYLYTSKNVEDQDLVIKDGSVMTASGENAGVLYIDLKEVINSIHINKYIPIMGQTPATASELFSDYVEGRHTCEWYEDTDNDGKLTSKDTKLKSGDKFKTGSAYLLKANVNVKNSERVILNNKIDFYNEYKDQSIDDVDVTFGTTAQTASAVFVYDKIEDEDYGFTIAGVEIKKSNCKDPLGSGSVSYEPATNTITFHKDINYSGDIIVYDHPMPYRFDDIFIDATKPVTIKSANGNCFHIQGIPLTFISKDPITLQAPKGSCLYLGFQVKTRFKDTKVIMNGKKGIDKYKNNMGFLEVKNSLLDITTQEMAIGGYNRGIELEDCSIKTPKVWEEKEITPEENLGYSGYHFFDENGKIIKRMLIEPDSLYDLYVAGVRVTDENKWDVLGDGKVSFSPASSPEDSGWLYIKGDIDGGDEPIVVSEIDSLCINAEPPKDSKITSITLKTKDTCAFVLNGKKNQLTADDLTLNFISTGDSCIYLRQGASLSVFHSTLTFKGANAIAAEPRTSSKILLNDCDITTDCTDFAIGNLNGSIVLKKCYVDDPAGAQIIVPSTNSTNSYYICDAEGNPLQKLHIKTGEKPQRLVGDVNKDGNITADDAIIVARLAAGYGDYAARYDSDVADMNGDGKVTADDAIIIARYAAGYGNYRDIYTKYI